MQRFQYPNTIDRFLPTRDEKAAIRREYKTRMETVLILTRNKSMFPKEVMALMFGFATSIAIGEKINEVEEIVARKTELHNAYLILMSIAGKPFTTHDELWRWMQTERRLFEYVHPHGEISWPLNNACREESKQFISYVQREFVDTASEFVRAEQLVLIQQNPFLCFTAYRYRAMRAILGT